MALMKYAELQVLEIERETSMSRTASAAGLQAAPVFERIMAQAGYTVAHRAHFDYERRPGFIYVRSRAISSRTNDNYDEFPAEEIEKAYRTFIGKPVFVNHHNDDHRRSRGVIIDAALHKDANPDGSPDTWVEVLMEVDALKFPLLAEAVVRGDIARTSMGTNVEYSVCTACGNRAVTPADYCKHIPAMKGMKIRRTTASGGQEEVLIAERCYGLGFFENSLLVEDPADPTAYVLGVDGDGVPRVAGLSLADTIFPSREEQEIRTAMRHEIDKGMDTRIVASLEQALASGKVVHRAVSAMIGKDFLCGAPGNGVDLDSFITNEPVNCPACLARMKELGVTAAMNDAVCENCLCSYNYSRINGTAVFHIPSNGQRGQGYRPAHDVTVQGTNDGDLWHFECPMCGYDNSQYTDADAYRELLGSVTAGAFERHQIMGNELQVGDRLSPTGKTRVTKIHDYNGHRIYQQKVRGSGAPSGGRVKHDEQMTVWRPKTSSLVKQADDDQCPYCSGDSMPTGGGGWRCLDGDHVWHDDDPAAQAYHGDGPQRGVLQPVPHQAINEVKAPAQVDTMRAERCPVCQDDEAFDGEKCGVCGYIQPPENFRDPDLTKAQEVDLRQDALEAPDADGNMEVDTDQLGDAAPDAPAAPDGTDGARTLQCDYCGEDFGADAEDADPTDDVQDPNAADEASADDPGTPQDEDSVAAPDDLSDLSDKTDEDLGLAPEDEAVSDVSAPTVEADPGPHGAEDADQISVSKGDVCPVCGQGTIVSVQPEPTGPGDNPKEVSRAMPEQQQTPKQPQKNSAMEARSRMLRAVAGQQARQDRMDTVLGALSDLVLEIASAAGLSKHPKFAALKTAADTNNSPEGTPATTSDEAKQPDAKDDPTNVGAAPAPANANVTPDAVTDVQSTDKVPQGQPVLQNLTDVTAPSASATPDPAGAHVEWEVRDGSPSQTVMDPPGSTGWTSSARQGEDPQERFTASLRLARLQIQAGLEQGEDLALGDRIAKSATALDEIRNQAEMLRKVIETRTASVQPVSQEHRHLVPQAAPRSAPSLVAPPQQVTAANEMGGTDEFGLGLDIDLEG